MQLQSSYIVRQHPNFKGYSSRQAVTKARFEAVLNQQVGALDSELIRHLKWFLKNDVVITVPAAPAPAPAPPAEEFRFKDGRGVVSPNAVPLEAALTDYALPEGEQLLMEFTEVEADFNAINYAVD